MSYFSATVTKVISISFLLCFLFTTYSFAQSTNRYGIGSPLPLDDKTLKDGSIISSTTNGFKGADRTYDPLMVGVVTDTPAVVFNSSDANTRPVVSSGNAYVIVSNRNGNIKKGDFITSSVIKGVGQKATKAGYILGTAAEPLENPVEDFTQRILVSVNISYYYGENPLKTSILDISNLSLIATYQQPALIVKYAIAGVILIVSFALGFTSYVKIAHSGIEALGRNPLASRAIQIGIFLNVLITMAIIGSGLFLGYVIITL
jgi:hypothetical protein